MTGATVTVPTGDYGDVTIPEPSWCLGLHPFEQYRVDITHEGEEVFPLIPTLCHGEAPTLSVSLIQRPFSAHRSQVVASMHLDGDWHELDSALLDRAASVLVEHATTLRHLARKLASLEVQR
ncbi:hypothetical protein ABZV60_19365 [Streptomyces sp. NPDC004787]|uniref:DUF6907 domain-containing protein n=1 Tax=Streptomyces sp. NPDC004787 TaxID=3154291 RepID=UPI0033A5B9E1